MKNVSGDVIILCESVKDTVLMMMSPRVDDTESMSE
jgi:hypothetical protein